MAKPSKKQSNSAKSPPNISQLKEDVLFEEIVKRVSSLVGRDQAAKVAAQVVAIYSNEQFSGPIAHPKHLREYDDIVPGSADRIIKMAED